MRVLKCLICILLSFSVMAVGLGFAQVTQELTATGAVNFVHTSLYISNISNLNGVTYLGHSGTLISGLTATSGATVTVSISNPLPDTYYYLNYTIGDSHKITLTHPDGTEFKLGTALKGNETVTFVAKFPEAVTDQHTLQFNFTLIPPDVGGGGNQETDTNATAVIQFVVNHVQYGLNSKETKHTFRDWCNINNGGNGNGNKAVRVLHCLTKNIAGGNLSNLFGAIDADNIMFTLEYLSETQYNLYLYYASSATDANRGKYTITYKQEIMYNSTDDLWVIGNSYKGYAQIMEEVNGNGIKHDGITVDWSSDLPDGATLV